MYSRMFVILNIQWHLKLFFGFLEAIASGLLERINRVNSIRSSKCCKTVVWNKILTKNALVCSVRIDCTRYDLAVHFSCEITHGNILN